MPRHALITGVNMSGRIQVAEHPDGWVDVTPEILYFEHDSNETPDIVHDVANAIEAEHYVRRTHPVDLACQALDDPDQYDPADPIHAAVREQMIADHRAEHQALHQKMADRGVSR
jgi:hypothetical protein